MRISMTNEMMRQIIMDHYSNPTNKRQPEKEGYEKIHTHTENCIDDLDIFLLIENQKIIDACFDGVACSISTSSTDIMCDLLKNKDIKEGLKIIDAFQKMVREEEFDETLLEEAIVFINTSKQAARINCAVSSWVAAKEILKDK
ncbi:MAG TPA: SUF system NifU family Fe-S cluster assembly protein [Erysipelotrichaceae bacterium]|nr:SUF system NifU family Fe-S cluster assembly protein [Erysipelotrichaceae bacterium]